MLQNSKGKERVRKKSIKELGGNVLESREIVWVVGKVGPVSRSPSNILKITLCLLLTILMGSKISFFPILHLHHRPDL